jgi:hypothetical protein
MTENTPVLRARNVPQPVQGAAQDQHDLQMAKAVAISRAGEMLPKNYRNQPGAVFLALEWAEQRNLAVLDVLHGVAFVHGKPVIDSTLQRALAIAAGYRLTITHADQDRATVVVSRNNEQLGTASFTIEEARTAGLAGKDNWKRHPTEMMVARATTRAIKWFCPEALLGGVLTEDELEGPEPVAEPLVERPRIVATNTHPVVETDAQPEPVVETSEDITDAEIVDTGSELATAGTENTQPDLDAPAGAMMRGQAKAVLDQFKGTEHWPEFSAAMKANGTVLAATKWTVADASFIVDLADTILGDEQ